MTEGGMRAQGVAQEAEVLHVGHALAHAVQQVVEVVQQVLVQADNETLTLR